MAGKRGDKSVKPRTVGGVGIAASEKRNVAVFLLDQVIDGSRDSRCGVHRDRCSRNG